MTIAAVGLVCLAAIGARTSAQTRSQVQGRWPVEFPPRPLASHDVKFPPYEVRKLPNGLQVVAVLHHEQPVVSMRMIVRAGSVLDPKGKQGLANLAASLLDQGTTTKSAREMNDAIDFIGGEMSAGSLPDVTFANVVVMKDSFDVGLQMLSDMARHPAFAQEELERQRQQVLSGLQVSLDDPGYVADAVFNRLVYGAHPYGMPEAGTPDTLRAITRDDLLAFHRRNFVANNAILAIVGDVTTDEAFDGVRRVFGDWEQRDVPELQVTAPPNPTRRVIVIDKPDAVQTEVRVGNLGVRRNQSDYMPLNLAIRILGGEGANRLHQVLRTDRGLTYGAQAEMHTLRTSGDIVAETSTRTDATGEVLRLIVEQIQRLQRERVADRELADAKAYMTGSFPITIETPDAIATQILNVLFYGLPNDELPSFKDHVNAVQPIDIERVARYYLMPDRLSVVLVGNAAKFASQLRGAGFGNFETIAMADLDLAAPDFKRPKGRADGTTGPGGSGALAAKRSLTPVAARSTALSPVYQAPAPSPVAARSARSMLESIVAAKGGADTLRAVKTLSAVTRSAVPTASGTRNAEVTTYLQYPNRVRVETRVGESVVVEGYDGNRGWMREANRTRDVPSQTARDLQATLRRDTLQLLVAAYDGKLRVRLLPDIRDDDGRTYHALEVSDLTLDPMVLAIDPDTSLIVRETYVSGLPGQPLVEERFTDYQRVDGVQIAFTARVRSGGQPVLERRITRIRINPPLDSTLFVRPVS